ncbi:uncharacterized protein KY384_009159 [Bacidia gigantensis]|uniref:uncharacterized protein n=1 Tax=Bacidia gigantensis TaxID=2732470 RepID=UPI001D03C6A8|nr:uncharacterized protein KY384_009159 [Bacidia gigantensis]KAG8525515.1 hypothetical protein KY384_009159 [Bacidia gigantensis]
MPKTDDSLPVYLGSAKASSTEQTERLSRSPHPYRRRGPSLSQSDEPFKSKLRSSLDHDIKQAGGEEGSATSYFDADHRKRRRSRDAASESGTEADDEKETFLLGLPAPPARPRKGLKEEYGASSPLLTPSYLDEEERKTAYEVSKKWRNSVQERNADEEAAKVRAKFRRRRRAELIRRITETALLLSICYISIGIHHQWPKDTSLQDLSLSSIRVREGLRAVTQPVPTFVAIISALYVLYPLRIIYNNHELSVAKRKSRFYIHLPAAFDPAPLLYPVLVPAIVAWSIAQDDAKVMLPNLVLGVASIPSKIIPFGNVPWCSSPQWLVSILPIWNLRKWRTEVSQAEALDPVAKCGLDKLVYLYPLHHALLPILQYLTTTSLLPTELQLLSCSLINLLLLSDSPQALILQILLWMGGVALLILCSQVLRWGVSIARIPSWRFRKPRHRNTHGNVVLTAVKDSLQGLNEGRDTVKYSSESSTEEGNYEQSKSSGRSGRKSLKVRTTELDSVNQQLARHNSVSTPMSASADGRALGSLDANGSPEQARSIIQRHRRSNTLPTNIRPSAAAPAFGIISQAGTRIFESGKLLTFRSMTAAQATLLRWIFAAYVYIVVVGLIAVPLRLYIAQKVFQGMDPVGWALGYMFGDLPSSRSFVERHNISNWMPLPTEQTAHSSITSFFHLNLVFTIHVGAANTRLLLCAYYIAVIALGLVIVRRLSVVVEVDTRRKVFHGMMVAMLLPTVFVDPTFVSLALIIVLAVFLILDLFRASQLPPVARPLTYFLAPYVDGRDHRGPVIVSHIFLLIGCAIPLWLSLSAISRTGQWPWQGWEVPTRDLSMVSGIVCVGMGDAAASLIGRRYGRRRWCWTGGKSLEGSLAFAVAVLVGLSAARIWLLIGGWDGDSGDTILWFTVKAGVAAAGASLTEAVLTGGNDNVIVPIVLWLLVRGLGL